MVSHYQPFLLVWCLTISRVCRYGVSLSAMPAGAGASDMSVDPVPLSDVPACTVQLYQTCMLGSFIQIHVFVKCFSIRQEIWYVTNPPDMPTG